MDDDKKKNAADKGNSLSEDQITSKRVDRRTLLRSAGLAGLGAGALSVSGCVVAGPTDGDSGTITDFVGRGRGPRLTYRSGITDSDFGNITDRSGQGRGFPY